MSELKHDVLSITSEQATGASARKRKRSDAGDGGEEVEVDRRPFTIKVGQAGRADEWSTDI